MLSSFWLLQRAGDEVWLWGCSGIQMLSKKMRQVAREYGWVYGELIGPESYAESVQ